MLLLERKKNFLWDWKRSIPKIYSIYSLWILLLGLCFSFNNPNYWEYKRDFMLLLELCSHIFGSGFGYYSKFVRQRIFCDWTKILPSIKNTSAKHVQFEHFCHSVSCIVLHIKLKELKVTKNLQFFIDAIFKNILIQDSNSQDRWFDVQERNTKRSGTLEFWISFSTQS